MGTTLGKSCCVIGSIYYTSGETDQWPNQDLGIFENSFVWAIEACFSLLYL